MDISHIPHKVPWYTYDLDMVLCIESCEREITSVAAPVTGHIQKYCGLTGKSKKNRRWTVFEENGGGSKKMKVVQVKAFGLVFIHKKERK